MREPYDRALVGDQLDRHGRGAWRELFVTLPPPGEHDPARASTSRYSPTACFTGDVHAVHPTGDASTVASTLPPHDLLRIREERRFGSGVDPISLFTVNVPAATSSPSSASTSSFSAARLPVQNASREACSSASASRFARYRRRAVSTFRDEAGRAQDRQVLRDAGRLTSKCEAMSPAERSASQTRRRI